MNKAVVVLAVLLAILHQDFWFWESRALLFGFLPVGLAYHAIFSILAAGLWWFAATYAWPETVADSMNGPRSE